MLRALILDAIGIVDGVNRDFSAPSEFVAGSLVPWINGGPLIELDTDGWVETGADTFRMNIAPTGGAFPDTVKAFAWYL